tara:strand:- start:2143 stop:3066 length:924 start_codon:yes stop_codon:yes gene_type:complete
MSKVAVYLSSRNNYSLLDSFMERNPTIKELPFYNVDDNSEDSERKLGKELCEKYGIQYVQNMGRGLQWSAYTMVSTVPDDCEFIIWTTHDTFTITKNFYKIYYDNIERLKDFGVIGFNILGPQCGIRNLDNVDSKTLGIIGRAPLANLPGRGGWYRKPDMNLDWDVWGGQNPIAIESPTDMILSFNVDLFKKIISVSNEYHLFCAWDDICMQFLESDTYNVILPFLQAFHNQDFKSGKVPVKSAGAAKHGDKRHFGHYGPHFEYWKSRWGWERDNVRNTFPHEKYEGSLISDFYNLDYKKGPLKVFK